eukprot:comp22516_c2_seq1/m.34124 comp22516_c2_seq1/g.34124  ORF comp22516_c2_seq1/g.34124 comp22516_c2_seq1/m.34124 type:complete len:122 (-) comp22516_c2_seq1:314-679(-)
MSVRFCQECNNMLYPKEDKERRILLLVCRNCDYQEEAMTPRVYFHKMQHDTDELTQIVKDVATDPTLPRTHDVECSKCGEHEAVFFQAQTRRAEKGMQLYFVCCNKQCDNRWTEATAPSVS